MEQQVKLLLDSYGLEKLLEIIDVSQERALETLILEGVVDLDEFFHIDGEDND